MTTKKVLLVACLGLCLVSPLWAVQALRYADFDLATGLNDGTSEANAWQSCSDLTTGVAAGHHVKVQRTASRDSENCTFTTDSGAADPIILEGYKTTPGNLTTPGDGADAGWDNAFHTSGQWSLANGYTIINFDFEGQPSAASGYLLGTGGAEQWVGVKVRIKNTRTDATVCAVTLDDEGTLINSLIFAPEGSCGVDIEDAGWLHKSMVDISATNATGGVLIEQNALRYQHVTFNIIRGSSKGGKGIYSDTYGGSLAKNRVILYNSIYDVDVGIELQDAGTAGGNALDVIVGNLIYTCNIGVHNESATSTAGVWISHNGIGDCATDDYQGWGDQATSLGAVSVTTGNPFNDAANWDFTITSGVTEVQCAGMGKDINLDGGDLNCWHLGAVQAVAPAAAAGRPKIW